MKPPKGQIHESEYSNSMRAMRMSEVPEAEEISVSGYDKQSEGGITASYEGGKHENPDWQDGGTFVRGGGIIDNDLKGAARSAPYEVQKGTGDVASPEVNKGDILPEEEGLDSLSLKGK